MNLRPVFFSAPHRMMFFAGSLQALIAMLLWAADLAARYAGLYPPLPLAIPSVWLHAALMLYGIFSFFIFGFLMTALPRWVAEAPLAQIDYVPTFFLLAGGWLVFYAGLLLPALLAPGLLIVSAGLLFGAQVLFAVTRASMNAHKTHAWMVIAAIAAGGCGSMTLAAGMLLVDQRLVNAGIEIGLWLFLTPVFFTVTYRMLPFFSGSVIRGYDEYRGKWPHWLVLACLVIHTALAIGDARSWLWLSDAAAGVTVLWLAWRWQLRKAFASHLLTMHHLAGLWLGLALLLSALQSALALGGIAWGGRAPLHALTVGYFASILIGMVTRVSLGHSGRLISSDVWSWPLFWGLQVVIVLRIGAEWAPAGGWHDLTWLSSLGWLLVFGLWVRANVAMYIRARPDGRPG